MLSEIVKHLMTYVGPAPDALVFTGPKGGALRRSHFNNLTTKDLMARMDTMTCAQR